jgi:hypothetical protein
MLTGSSSGRLQVIVRHGKPTAVENSFFLEHMKLLVDAMYRVKIRIRKLYIFFIGGRGGNTVVFQS